MRRYLLLVLFVSVWSSTAYTNCVGRFVNPITDVCWKCLFPLTLGGIKVVSGGPDPKSPKGPLCFCRKPPLNIPIPGIPVGFWEPVRLVDVTRTPFCLVSMGGLCLGGGGAQGRGDIEENPDDGTHHSFYQVHWYTYPIMTALEVLVDFACLESTSIDLAYLTELDPLWNDDEKSAILNPEGILFGNPIAQAACVADCVAATAHLPRNELFWCGGCQGSLYPFAGTVSEHMGGVQASLLLTQRMMAKLHREFLLMCTSGKESLCDKTFAPLIKKTQYRTQMIYPLVTQRCDPLGHSEVMWQRGREFPYKGGDFGYLIWRKRDCCVL